MIGNTFKISIRGKVYDIKIGDLQSSPISVWVDGVEYHVGLPEENSDVAPPVEIPEKKPNEIGLKRPTPKTSSAEGTIRAPMPGTILKINVVEGDSVNKGDVLLILESMKMENSITSPKTGSVTSVYVSEGDPVQHGETLIDLK